ncbi:MAG: NADH-quinone oxidoreductase subunit J [Planctomycetota bacterium]|nr:MAG: NADH-quinone oxidoreductase subunit J [Planctomycetota bacterium]
MAALLSFILFAGLSIGCALLCLFHRSVVISAFSLLGTLLGVAGLFLMLGADFLAMTQVLIYAGGILVLILFGLMLTPGDPGEMQPLRIFGGLAIVGGGAVLFLMKMAGVAEWGSVEVENLPAPQPTVDEIGLELLRRDSYLLPFELASVILLAALVGAVFIARRRFEYVDEGGKA